ncbi:septation protein SepH [Cellulomonas sp. PhB143]|uniref:septation protein SepH n=1 Tax=Cellulomonas sp. PhB143 TaxID=2485186 RepID=UPI000FC2420D|nr:septation protein SepH [Cellulomonas sp. PhB143]ROS72988.1 DUF3071 family protein [Cellulomonas sp. PhB143]
MPDQELELVKLHDDGEHLVLSAPGGQRYLLPITESLRAAVRRDRARLEHWRASETTGLAPREIQARLRAGESARDVAESAGVPVEHVRRYEGPVVAEQDYVVARLRATEPNDRAGDRDERGSDEQGEPVTLGERIDARLEVRGIDDDDRTWTATRSGSEPWTVRLSFPVGGQERAARWTFDPQTREHHPLDDEARWLGQPDADDDTTDLMDATRDGDGAPAWPGADHADEDEDAAARRTDAETDATVGMLDDLRRRRGTRQERPSSMTEVFDGFGDAGPDDAPGSGSSSEPGTQSGRDAGTEPDAARTASRGRVLRLARPGGAAKVDAPAGPDAPKGAAPATGPTDDAAEASAAAGASRDAPAQGATAGADPSSGARPAERRQGRKGRSKVPSWDEIVFGAKHD